MLGAGLLLDLRLAYLRHQKVNSLKGLASNCMSRNAKILLPPMSSTMLSKQSGSSMVASTGLKAVKVGQGIASGEYDIPDSSADKSHHLKNRPVIHPVTMDTCLQIIWSTLPHIATLQGIYVPSYIKCISVSLDAGTQFASRLSLHGRLGRSDSSSREVVAFMSAYRDGLKPVVQVEGLCMRQSSDAKSLIYATKTAFKLKWKPDLHFLTPPLY